MAWVQIALWIASTIISIALAPDPKSRPPAGLGDFQVPSAEVGREIPVLFGTRDIKGPNVTWYGHLRSKAVKKGGGGK